MTHHQSEKIGVPQIIEEAMSWQGTPYKHQASCKGAGCDCLGLIRGVYRCFWAEPELPPSYSPDWADAGGEETFANAANRYLQPIEIEHLQAGNVMLFRYRANHPAKHAGILINADRFLHAQHGSGVVLVSLNDWWRRHIAYAFSFPLSLR
ncbi:NlpC/P60 family protein [Cohaesibacter celericrescens]|uniref:Peptidase P60 n=1 Tax=Cohaesibacter celericrescens TaxID=2067669 RepID=A0A2N5XR04_9HYPH|nr:NlpC/P60 family protein [Cohaesibacter celericrescens]PLW76952.1 peptidase P60 [Cohaesibacter celericrescens]